MSDTPKTDVLPDTPKQFLVRLAVSLGLALVCWPAALYALHGYFFRSADTSGNGQIIFAGVVLLIAIVATWFAVFLLSSGEE